MNKIEKEWFNKISRILVEVPDLQLRLNKLEEIRNHIFDSLKDPEGEFPMLVKKINGEIEETKDEIKNQGKSGLDLILEAAEKIEKAETEFYHNENVFKTKDDDSWSQVVPILRSIQIFQLNDTIEVLMLSLENRKVYDFLSEKLVDPFIILIEDLRAVIEKEELKWGVRDKSYSVRENAILNFHTLLEETFSVIEKHKPAEMISNQYVDFEIENVNRFVKNRDLFFAVERILVERKFIHYVDDRPVWIVNKKKNLAEKRSLRQLYELYLVLKEKYKVFIEKSKGRNIKDWQILQFLSKRYGFSKSKLNETKKSYKQASLKMAETTYFFLNEELNKINLRF